MSVFFAALVWALSRISHEGNRWPYMQHGAVWQVTKVNNLVSSSNVDNIVQNAGGTNPLAEHSCIYSNNVKLYLRLSWYITTVSRHHVSCSIFTGKEICLNPFGSFLGHIGYSRINMFFSSTAKNHRSIVLDISSGSRSFITNSNRKAKAQSGFTWYKTLNFIKGDTDPRAQLSLNRFPRNTVGMKREAKGNPNANKADGADDAPNYCPPGGVSGCVRRFPLSAQIGIACIIFGAAWLALWRAFYAFGFIVIPRGWQREMAGYFALSMGLFAAGVAFWMLPG